MQYHVSKIKPSLSILNLVINPLSFCLLDIFSHQLCKFLMSKHVATFLFSLSKKRRNYFFTMLILSLHRCCWQWCVNSSSTSSIVSKNFVFCSLKNFFCLFLRSNFFECSAVCAPWHWFSLCSIGSFIVKCIIQCFKKSIVMYISHIIIFFL